MTDKRHVTLHRSPRFAGLLLLSAGLALPLTLAGGAEAAATAVSSTLSVPVEAGNSGALAGHATLTRSALAGGAEELSVTMVITRSGGGDGSHLCLSATPWLGKADFPSCTYANTALHQTQFTYQEILGSGWVGKVINIQLQTRVAKVGNPTHTENAYAGWQPHGDNQDHDQYGQLALPPPVTAVPSPSPSLIPPVGAASSSTAPPVITPTSTASPTATVPTPSARASALLAAAASVSPPSQIPAGASLPFTGPSVPVADTLLTALALILTGTACLLGASTSRSSEW